MIRDRRLAIVTGASRGIGAAIGLELAARGFDVAVADVQPPSQETLSAFVAAGADVRYFPFDLADDRSHPAVLDAIVDWGGSIATLVNNAGIGSPSRGDLLDVAPESFDRVVGVNLRGTFLFTQAVARHMVSVNSTHSRSIVTISSVSAAMASVERGEYCISKAGLAMVTSLFALRLAPHGIGVFEIRPGIIKTPMTEPVAQKYDERIRDGLVPMCRWGQPEDVARATAALATGDLQFATGSVLQVDGALSIPRF